MSCTVIERVLQAPIDLAELGDLVRRGEWCRSQYGVGYLGSLLGAGSLRMTCFYRAPDAESVRVVNRLGGMPFERAWSASVNGPDGNDPLSGGAAGPGGTLVVVERGFAEPASFQALDERGTRYRWCAEAYGVTFLRSYFAADQRRMLCIYRAPDAESVRHVQTQAAMPFERIWAARLFPAQ